MADKPGVPKAMDTSSSNSRRKRSQAEKRGRKGVATTPKPTSESDADSESSLKTSSSSELNRPLAKVHKPLDSQESSHDSDRICIDQIQSPMPDKTVPVSDNININVSLNIAEEELVAQEGPPPLPLMMTASQSSATRRPAAARHPEAPTTPTSRGCTQLSGVSDRTRGLLFLPVTQR